MSIILNQPSVEIFIAPLDYQTPGVFPIPLSIGFTYSPVTDIVLPGGLNETANDGSAPSAYTSLLSTKVVPATGGRGLCLQFECSPGVLYSARRHDY